MRAAEGRRARDGARTVGADGPVQRRGVALTARAAPGDQRGALYRLDRVGAAARRASPRDTAAYAGSGCRRAGGGIRAGSSYEAGGRNACPAAIRSRIGGWL